MFSQSPNRKNHLSFTLNIFFVAVLFNGCDCRNIPKLATKTSMLNMDASPDHSEGKEEAAKIDPTPETRPLNMEISSLKLIGDRRTIETKFSPLESEKTVDLTPFKMRITLTEVGGQGSRLKYVDATQSTKYITNGLEENISHFLSNAAVNSQGDPLKVAFEVVPALGVTAIKAQFELVDQNNQSIQAYEVNWESETTNKEVDLILTSNNKLPIQGNEPLYLTIQNKGTKAIEPEKLKCRISQEKSQQAVVKGAVLKEDVYELLIPEAIPMDDIGISKALTILPNQDKKASFKLQLVYMDGDVEKLIGESVKLTWEEKPVITTVTVKDIQYDANSGSILYNLTNESTVPVQAVKLHYVCKTSDVSIEGNLLTGIAEISIGDMVASEQKQINSKIGFIDFAGNQQIAFDCWVAYHTQAGELVESSKQTVVFTSPPNQLKIVQLTYNPAMGGVIFNLKNTDRQAAYDIEFHYRNMNKGDFSKSVLLGGESVGNVFYPKIDVGDSTGDQFLPIQFISDTYAKFKFEIWSQSNLLDTQELEVIAPPVKLQLVPVGPTFLTGNNRSVRLKVEQNFDSGPINLDKLSLLITNKSANAAKIYYNQLEVNGKLSGAELTQMLIDLAIEPDQVTAAVFDFQILYDDMPMGKSQTFTWQANINQVTNKLFEAVLKHDAKAVKGLIHKKGVEVNVTDEKGEALLYKAVISADEAVISALLDAPNLHVNFQVNELLGMSLLHAAVYQGKRTIIEGLLKKGANPNARDAMGYTPLHLAISAHNQEAMDVLLQTPGIKLNTRDDIGYTPLHLAVEKGDEATVKKILLSQGVDSNIPDSVGRTPLHLAVSNKKEAIVKLLLHAPGVNINAPDFYGNTPMHNAIAAYHESITALLVEKGASLELKNKAQQTPGDLFQELHETKK